MNLPREIGSIGKCVTSLCAALVVSGVFLFSSNGMAQVTLTDGGSTATLNLGSGSGALGMNGWYVLNQNQLAQQWFWYSVGGGVAQPINSLGLMSSTLTGNNQVAVVYGSATGLSIEVDYALTGGGVGSGNADMMENIYVDNYSTSQSISDFNLYEYSNFNLLQSGNNSVTIFPSTDPLNPGYQAVNQTSGGTAIQEAIVSPYANYAEAAIIPNTLNNITTLPGYNLNDILTATGDVSWAFQWNVGTLGPQTEGLNIVKDKTLSVQAVPEPSTLALIALGMAALGLTLRRKLA